MKNIILKSLIAVCLIILATENSTSQNLDSLKKIAIKLNDTTQAETFHVIGKYYFNDGRNIDSAIKYEHLAYESAVKDKSVARSVISKINIGFAYIERLQYDLAKEELNMAMEIANKNKFTKGVIDVNNMFGYLYGKVNDLNKATFYYLNSAKNYELLKDYRNLAETYSNISAIFTLQEQNNKIIEYVNKSLEVIPFLNSKKDADIIVATYALAAQHYFLVSGKEKNNSYLKIALQLSDSCLHIASKHSIKYGLFEAYYIKSLYYKNIKDYSNCIVFAKKGLEYKNSMDNGVIFNFHITMADSYMNSGDLKIAQLYLDSCYLNPESKELDNPFYIAEFEYKFFKKTGNDTKTLKALEKLMIEKEKLHNNEKNKTINDLEGKYQNELKESKIKELNQKSEIDKLQIRSLIGIVGAIILLLVMIVFFYRQSIIKNKLKTIETEQRLNRARMNPHFFFNALASLQNLSLSDSKKDLVPGFISKFSKIMRQSLESTFNELDTIENEISFLTDYLELQKLRSENRFNYEFELDDSIETNELLIPGMILQPFIENSIEHGFKNSTHKGLISISFIVKDKLLQITIIDNGQGINDNEKHKTYPSRATQIIKDRLFLLNKTYKSNANFVLTTLQNDTGIKVEINLPVIYKT